MKAGLFVKNYAKTFSKRALQKKGKKRVIEKQKLALLSQFPFLGNAQVSSQKEGTIFNENSPSAMAVLFCLLKKLLTYTASWLI